MEILSTYSLEVASNKIINWKKCPGSCKRSWEKMDCDIWNSMIENSKMSLHMPNQYWIDDLLKSSVQKDPSISRSKGYSVNRFTLHAGPLSILSKLNESEQDIRCQFSLRFSFTIAIDQVAQFKSKVFAEITQLLRLNWVKKQSTIQNSMVKLTVSIVD